MALKLTPNPTFKAKVDIRVPGEKTPQKVGFTFKHKTTEDLQKFHEWIRSGADDAEAIMDIATAWDVDAEFGEDTIRTFLNNYPGANMAVVTGYLKELTGAPMGN